MVSKKDKNLIRKRKHLSIRKKISGTTERPRLTVFKSLNNIFVQIIDDTKQTTLVSASTIEKDGKIKNGSNLEAAKIIGKRIAEKALSKGIKAVVFDRSGYVYTGKIKALADAAREAGLEF